MGGKRWGGSRKTNELWRSLMGKREEKVEERRERGGQGKGKKEDRAKERGGIRLRRQVGEGPHGRERNGKR